MSLHSSSLHYIDLTLELFQCFSNAYIVYFGLVKIGPKYNVAGHAMLIFPQFAQYAIVFMVAVKIHSHLSMAVGLNIFFSLI